MLRYSISSGRSYSSRPKIEATCAKSSSMHRDLALYTFRPHCVAVRTRRIAKRRNKLVKKQVHSKALAFWLELLNTLCLYKKKWVLFDENEQRFSQVVKRLCRGSLTVSLVSAQIDRRVLVAQAPFPLLESLMERKAARRDTASK